MSVINVNVDKDMAHARISMEIDIGTYVNVPVRLIGLTDNEALELAQYPIEALCWYLPRLAMSQIARRLLDMKTIGGRH